MAEKKVREKQEMKNNENYKDYSMELFKELSPDRMRIEGNKITIESLTDFGGVGQFFAFWCVAEKSGYFLYAEKENLTFDGSEKDESNKLFALAVFVKLALEKRDGSTTGGSLF